MDYQAFTANRIGQQQQRNGRVWSWKIDFWQMLARFSRWHSSFELFSCRSPMKRTYWLSASWWGGARIAAVNTIKHTLKQSETFSFSFSSLAMQCGGGRKGGMRFKVLLLGFVGRMSCVWGAAKCTLSVALNMNPSLTLDIKLKVFLTFVTSRVCVCVYVANMKS